jgi:hypothetical protein
LSPQRQIDLDLSAMIRPGELGTGTNP